MRITVESAFDSWLDGTQAALKAATQGGVAAATQGLKLQLRQHVAAAIGTRAGNMIGASVHPEGRVSMRAAGSIYARGPLAERILEGFTLGSTIINRSGGWLAIPTNQVPVLGRGVPITVRAVEAYYGRPLRYVSPTTLGKPYGLFVLDDVVAARNGRGVKNATRRRRAQGRKVKSAVMFILMKSVRLPRKLAPGPIVETWAARVPEFIARSLPEGARGG